MTTPERADDFEQRRLHLRTMSDQALHAYFWQLAERVVAPLIAEARTHTTPSIERSVLLRMGFSSVEAAQLVDRMGQQNLLGYGAGHLLLQLAKRNRCSVRQAGEALLQGRYWQELEP